MFFNNSERKGVTILIILILILLLLPRFIIHFTPSKDSTVSNNNVPNIYNSQTEQKEISSILKNKVTNKKKSQSKLQLEKEPYKKSLYKKDYEEDYKKKKGSKSKFFNKINYKKRIYPINTRKYDSFKIELNTADTNSLIKIKGIGKYYASKIINYRHRLGGFIDLNQLEDINMQYLDIATIRAHLYINKNLIIKKDLNALSFKEILKHPYLDYNDVILIFQAKKEYKEISVQILLQKGILIKSKIKQIQPYFK